MPETSRLAGIAPSGAPRTSLARRVRLPLRVPATMVAAALLGGSGPVLAAAGHGRVPVSEELRLTAPWVVLALALAVVVGAVLLRRRWPSAPLAVEVVVLAIGVPWSASGLGRMSAVVTVALTGAAVAAVAGWWSPATRRVTEGVTWSAALATGLGGLVWWSTDRWAPTLLLAAAAVGAAEWRSLRGDEAPPEAAVRRVGVGAAALGGSIATSSLRRTRVAFAQLIARSGLRREHRSAVVVVAAVTGAATPVLWRLVNALPRAYVVGVNDYDLHIDAAREVTWWPPSVPVPHSLFHLATSAVASVAGWRLAPVLVLAAAAAVTATAVVRLMAVGVETLPGRARWGLAAAGTALFFLAENPTMAARWLGWSPASSPILSVHAWYSPTWVLTFALALAAIVRIERWLRSPAGVADAAAVGALVLAGALAKPSLSLVLPPGLALYVLVADRAHWRRHVPLMAAVTVPAVLVSIWQVWFMEHATTELGANRFTFDPIVSPPFGWSRTGPWFWLPLAIPIAAVVATRGAFVRDRLVRLMLACSVFGLAILLLFREEGPRARHGNLGVPMQLCLAVLMILSVRTLVSVAVARWRGPGRRAGSALVIGLLLAAFVAGGLVTYGAAMGWITVEFDWSAYA